jgi:hypothetical protein
MIVDGTCQVVERRDALTADDWFGVVESLRRLQDLLDARFVEND